jgi:hypothetical protein
MQLVIDGDAAWDTFYNRELVKCASELAPNQNKWGDRAARQEYDAFKELWLGRVENAATQLMQLASEVDTVEPALGAWYRHWAAAATHLSGTEAEPLYRQAANVKSVLGNTRTRPEISVQTPPQPSSQARRAASVFDANALKRIEEIRKLLGGDGGVNATDHEQALQDAGFLLGFDASRPDHELGKGPDVLWRLEEERVALGMEAKTQKQNPKMYKKNVTIGKLHNDLQWMVENLPDFVHQQIIVGPLVGVVKEASPPPGLRVAPLANFQNLTDKLLFAAQYVAAAPTGLSREAAIQLAFEVYGLLWPRCIDSMDYRLASDLQAEELESKTGE